MRIFHEEIGCKHQGGGGAGKYFPLSVDNDGCYKKRNISQFREDISVPSKMETASIIASGGESVSISSATFSKVIEVSIPIASYLDRGAISFEAFGGHAYGGDSVDVELRLIRGDNSRVISTRSVPFYNAWRISADLAIIGSGALACHYETVVGGSVASVYDPQGFDADETAVLQVWMRSAGNPTDQRFGYRCTAF